MDYKGQYKHPKWQRRRLEILHRDKFACQKCGDEETTLHIHHIKYYRNRKVWDYKDFDLDTLCEHCHLEIEKIKPLKAEYKKIKIFKSIGWTDGSRIMFVSHNGNLGVEIYNENDDQIIGYTMQDDLPDMYKLIRYTMYNAKTLH